MGFFACFRDKNGPPGGATGQNYQIHDQRINLVGHLFLYNEVYFTFEAI